MATHRTLGFLFLSFIVLPPTDRCSGGVRTWDAGGNGTSWEHNCNWSGPENQGVCFGLQPFDGDDVIIPFGNPVVTFLEGINTLDVNAGADISNNGVLSVHNGVVNDGSIAFGPNAQLIIDAGDLGGTGETVLADSTGTFAVLQGAPFISTLVPVTHAATHTIRGEGTVTGKWINDGLIRAEETSGDSTATLLINGAMTNNGVIRSSATGALRLESLTLTMGATGQLIADTQSVQLGTATILGGSIDAINGGKFVRRDAGGTAVFSGVTINGDFDVLVTNAGIAGIGTGITNNGTLTLDNLGVANGEFFMESGSTLDGTGQVILNRANDSTHLSGSFTHGASHTIRGVGRFHAAVVNNGSILAEPKNGGSLLRIVGNTISNNNLLQANNGATMRFEQEVAVTQGTSGRIRAAEGGRVELLSAFVTDGKLQTSGTGLIVDTGGSTLTNVTNEGAFHVQGGGIVTTRLKGTTLTNNGTMTVNPTGVGGIVTGIQFGSNVTIQGTGSIVLNQTGNNARITSATGDVIITQAAGHTIRGKGVIDNGTGSGGFVNHGRLEGDSALEPLAIFTRLSGEGDLKDVTIGGGFVQIPHILGQVGTTAVVDVDGLYGFGRNSSLLIDLAGAAPGTGYDQLNSNGPITLSNIATRLEVSLADGFKPLPGDSFTPITTTGSITGNFGTVVLPTLPLGLSWTQSQSSTDLSISVIGSLAADFDEDGDVDGDDLTRWQAGYGTGSAHMQGNADGDGDVDGRDFLIWQRSVGWGVPAIAISQAVPEPGALSLMVLLGAGWFSMLRRQAGAKRSNSSGGCPI